MALITTLPTENATIRQRIWRGLRSSGAAVLLDGVYLMPEQPACRAVLESIASDVRECRGTNDETRFSSTTPVFDGLLRSFSNEAESQ